MNSFAALIRSDPTPLIDRMSGRENNFDLIRIVAAACVLISHSYPIALGASAAQPLTGWLGQSLGHVSVGVFFAISGFLIAKSYDQRSNAIHFLVARAFRIFPALIVVLVLTLMFLGVGVTDLNPNAYFLKADTWTYFFRNLSLFSLQYELPGVFEDNPYGPAINGSLWTLKHEVLCYIGILVAGIFGVMRRRRVFLSALFVYIVFFLGFDFVKEQLFSPHLIDAFRKLSIYFVIGAALYVFRERVVLDKWLIAALLVGTIITYQTPVFDIAFALLVSYSTLVAAYSIPNLSYFYRRHGDFSYGLYIYAFPIQQLVAYVDSSVSPVTLMLASFPIAMLFAIASWYLVERPSLDLSKNLTRRKER